MDASADLDWVKLGSAIGEHGGGTHAAQQALEYLLGRETIEAAVEIIVTFGPGWELAENVLVFLGSAWALECAYHIYQTSTGERKRLAVWLIKNLARPESLAWVPQFLADDESAAGGMDVLDQLIFAQVADPESAEVEAVLAQAEQHADEHVRQKAAYIRAYLRQWDGIDALERAYYDSHGIPGFPPDGTS